MRYVAAYFQCVLCRLSVRLVRLRERHEQEGVFEGEADAVDVRLGVSPVLV